MSQLKCPHCGQVFQVDESDYAAIIDQVRTAEFQKDLEQRIHAEHKLLEENRLRSLAEREAQLKSSYDDQINKMREEALTKIDDLKQQLGKKELQITELNTQLKTNEEASILRAEKAKDELYAGQIQQLKESIQNKDLALARLEAEKKGTEGRMAEEKKNAVLEEQQRSSQVLQQKDTEIEMLKNEVERQRNFKLQLSTKMVGESLEQHCSQEFARIAPFLHNVVFGKDNDVSEGSKGDFILRANDEKGREYLSIMFEMKNEMEQTLVKHKNEDFFKKLDSDRIRKKCEYAVLVSLLEQDNELYNTGIVSIASYEKMYVIRPQFFIPLITILMQASSKNIELQHQLEMAQQQSLDITNFEKKLGDFKRGFEYNYEQAVKKFDTAIDEIDKSIKALQKVRDNLVGSKNNLSLAAKRTDDLTIKKLTWGNPTMKQMLSQQSSNDAEGEE